MQFPRAVKSCGSLDHDNYNVFSSFQIPHGGNNLEVCGIENEGDQIGIVHEDEKGEGAVDGEDLSAVVKKYKKSNQGFQGSQLQVAAVPHFHHYFPRSELLQWVTTGVIGRGGEMEFGIKRFHHVNGGAGSTSPSLKEIHSFSERVRRTEMNQLFAQMSSLLPTSAVQRSKACIVSDIVDYIESLQHQLALHSTHNGRRSSLLGNSSTPGKEFPSPALGRSDSMPTSNKNCIDENLNVICNGNDIFIHVKSVKKANVLTAIIYAVESHNMQVINGFTSTTDTVAFHCLHAKVADILAPEAKETLFRSLKRLMKSEFKICLKSE